MITIRNTKTGEQKVFETLEDIQAFTKSDKLWVFADDNKTPISKADPDAFVDRDLIPVINADIDKSGTSSAATMVHSAPADSESKK